MLSLLSPEQRVPRDHPLRRIEQLADAALQQLSPVFDQMYSAMGRPSVPPERLLNLPTILMSSPLMPRSSGERPVEPKAMNAAETTRS